MKKKLKPPRGYSAAWLKAHGLDGLCRQDCGCGLDNLAPCESGPGPDCVPAYRIPCCAGHGQAGSKYQQVELKTIGWRPTCACPAAEPVPCTVLDQFLGSGTTAIVAVANGRNAIGIELSPEYVRLAKKRIQREVGLLI